MSPCTLGTNFLSSIASCAIKIFPCSSSKGRVGLGTALDPMCFLSWLTWNVWCNLDYQAAIFCKQYFPL
jgi:hypothetical protein